MNTPDSSAEQHVLRLIIEVEREVDGRWIADVVALPGVMVYGATREEALAKCQALALRVLADRVESGETTGELAVSFHAAA
jgi:predicted RNase H-like HicB family nuclease